MTPVHDFPTIPVSKQLFHVPGAAAEGGLTSGSVRIMSPEPGGRSMLELQVALQVREWEYPESSWLMSKGNGDVFRVRLAPTPQVLSARVARNGPLWAGDVPWTGDVPWSGDITAFYATEALEGSTTVRVNMTGYGDIARRGHTIGHGDNCYKIDSVMFDADTQIATMTLMPPLRKNVHVGDPAFFRPFFLGTIANIGEVRTTYDSELNGMIQIGKIVFTESIL